MGNRKKAGWGNCQDCYRAKYPNFVCEEAEKHITPPCCISTFLTHLKFEQMLKKKKGDSE